MFRFFSLPVLNAVAFLTIFALFVTTTKTKRRRVVASQSKQRNEDWFRGCGGGVCVWVPSVCCEYVLVGWALSEGGVRLSIVCTPAGAWIVCRCVCVIVSSALSLSVLSHCFSVSLCVPLTCFDLHLNLITFTRKYYLLLCFVLLPLICNNSCILRDATVCVCVFSFFLFLWGCDSFYLQ